MSTTRQPEYNRSESITVPPDADAYAQPSFSFGNRALRSLWNICWLLLYRPSPRPLHAWRSLILRLFGAKLGPNCHFYPSAKIWAPWNLICADQVTAGDGVEIYNPAPIVCGSHVIFSQGSYICGATHDYDDPAFPLLAYRMTFGAYAWICARASVAPGVNIGEGAVLGLGSVATRDLSPWIVYAGVPAEPIRERVRTHPTGDVL
jgi:putative colanic acid biosynthesis acetyltransferase WcaF